MRELEDARSARAVAPRLLQRALDERSLERLGPSLDREVEVVRRQRLDAVPPGDLIARGRCATSSTRPSVRTMARSTTFSSSRTFPGQL